MVKNTHHSFPESMVMSLKVLFYLTNNPNKKYIQVTIRYDKENGHISTSEKLKPE